jgi:hypothetical protein
MDTIKYKGVKYVVRHCPKGADPCKRCAFRDDILCPDCRDFFKRNKKGEATRLAYFAYLKHPLARPDLLLALFVMALLAIFSLLLF